MKKNSLNPKYFLFLLLVPVAIFIYFFKVVGKKKGQFVQPLADDMDFVPEESVATPNGLNDRQMAILEYMRKNNGTGKVSDMVTMFSQTDRTLRRDLNKLEGLGVVSRSGSTKSVVYSLVK